VAYDRRKGEGRVGEDGVGSWIADGGFECVIGEERLMMSW